MFIQTHKITPQGKIYKIVDNEGRSIKLLDETMSLTAINFEREIAMLENKILNTKIDALQSRIEKLEMTIEQEKLSQQTTKPKSCKYAQSSN